MAMSFNKVLHHIKKEIQPVDKNKIKEKALEHIVMALIELEEGSTRTYTIQVLDDRVSIFKSLYSHSFRLVVLHDTMTISWMGEHVKMNRAKSEEEYFQMMCLDDTYCDEEFEQGVKQLIDLHLNLWLKKTAIGGFLEGVYDDQSDS